MKIFAILSRYSSPDVDPKSSHCLFPLTTHEIRIYTSGKMKSSPYFLMKDTHMLAEISYWRFLSSLPSTHSQKICRVLTVWSLICWFPMVQASKPTTATLWKNFQVSKVLQKIIIVLRRQIIVRKLNFSLYMWKKNIIIQRAVLQYFCI